MQSIDISTGKISNRVTRMLDISVDAPESVVLNRRIIEYPVRRKNELDALNAELEEKYSKAVEEQNAIISQRTEKLKSVRNGLSCDKRGKEGSIQTISNEIARLNSDIDMLTESIKKDITAIRWMNVWRVIWGILCTAGIAVVAVFFIVGFIFKIIGFFMPGSNNDD